MFAAIAELCLTVIAVALTIREVVWPIFSNKPVFPSLRALFGGKEGE